MSKKCEIEIKYCNSLCPHFYHKFSDHENIWCGKLERKIYEAGENDDMMFDFSHRAIPNVCPLEDV